MRKFGEGNIVIIIEIVQIDLNNLKKTQTINK